MNVLSLFNGMSFGRMALDSLGMHVDKYYSSEIDKCAIKAAQTLFPGTIQLGDILNWREWDIDWSSIDLVTGGFPCQAWSMAGKQLGDKDERGMLFWTMLDIMKHVKHYNPDVKFMIENVKMKKEFEQYITTHTENALGSVHKILINSALVSAQNRNRYYWTNFKVEQPEDHFIDCSEIIDRSIQKPNSDGWQVWWLKNKEFQLKKRYSCILNDVEKGITQTARQVSSWNGCLVRNKKPFIEVLYT
jgi:site-specific DNA-cytosine methylase